MTSAVLMRVQNALGLPITGGAIFTNEMGAALDAWLAERGAPVAKAAIIAALLPLKDVGTTEALKLTDTNLNDLADAYMRYKGLPAEGDVFGTQPSWLRRNWLWLTIGGVVVVGGAVGGYFWWKKSKKPMGELEGLGCPCALGHSGRTSVYAFPSGKKRGHYRDSTGRFHSHS
jgi:hypothetical protein